MPPSRRSWSMRAAWRQVPIGGTLAARHEMVYNHSMEFEWAREKAKRNLKKHGVSFDEAATVFYDPLSATFTDPEHALGEHRFITIGHSSHGRLLLVSHTDRRVVIRIISARPATAHERKRHEK